MFIYTTISLQTKCKRLQLRKEGEGIWKVKAQYFKSQAWKKAMEETKF